MKLEFPVVMICFRLRKMCPCPFPRDGDIHSRILHAADRGNQAVPDPGGLAAHSRWHPCGTRPGVSGSCPVVALR